MILFYFYFEFQITDISFLFNTDRYVKKSVFRKLEKSNINLRFILYNNVDKIHVNVEVDDFNL